MSIFHAVQAVCGHCGHRNDVQRSASVNADRRPDLRQAILDGTFQRETCAKCGTVLRLPPHCTYFDLRRGQWLLVEPAAAVERWRVAEAEARRTWDRAFGARSTAQARALGGGLRARLVLGWPAAREKILAAEIGLDDVTLELLKLDLIRDMDAPPLADQTELRLVAGDGQTLRMDWLELATERAIEGVEVTRGDYDAVASAAADWAEAREKFDGALFVDWRRMVFDGVPA